MLSAAAAIFPGMTLHQLLWDVPEVFLIQCENLYAHRNGWVCVRGESQGADLDFIKRWEMTTGRKWKQ
jgi:hypothetical protein